MERHDKVSESLFVHLDPDKDPQATLRAVALRRFSYLWLILDQLPGGGWGKSVTPWMEENWAGASMRSDATMDGEGGFETSVFSFDIYCAVRNAQDRRPLYDAPVVAHFRRYLKNHWDRATKSFGTHATKQEGLVLTSSLRHTVLGAYGLLLLNQVMRQVERKWITMALNSLFRREREEYEEQRNAGLAYILMHYLAETLSDRSPGRRFNSYTAPDSVLDAIESWREFHQEGMKEAFLKDEYTPIPPRGKKPTEVSSYPFMIPYGSFYRMTTYTHLSACRFVTPGTAPEVRDRLADGVEALCRRYTTRSKASRYQRGDTLKPTVRGIQPWPDADLVDLGATAQLLYVLSNPDIVASLWPGRDVPDTAKGMTALLHEDLVEQFDRHLIEPTLLRHTPATTLAYVLLAPWDWSETHLEEVEEAVASYSEKHGLSEWSLNRIVDELVFQRETDLPTHLFTRSLGRLLLDRTQPGHYPVGPLAFNGDLERADRVADRTAKRYQDSAFAQKFDLVHGGSPYKGLADMFIELVKERKGKTVLDIGSGPGQYAKIFQDAGLDVTLLDISQAMLSIARHRLGWPDNDRRAVEGDLREVERVLRRRKFDAIWCCSTLIHFPESLAEQILRSLTRLLKKSSGILMVNCAIRNQRLVAEDGRFYAYWHLAQDFSRLIDACGYRVEKSLSTEVSRNVYWEPRLTIRWDSFFCSIPEPGGEDEESILARARDMTSTAYGQIVPRFADEHGDRPSTKTIEQFLSRLPKGSRIIDAGCGPGHYTALFWKRGHHGIGLDLCPEMISHAREKYRDMICDTRRFEIGDMCHLADQFEAESCEGVFCMAAFQHVPAVNDFSLRSLQGFWKVLKPGGYLMLDVQLHRTTGFEPDGRYTQGYDSVEQAHQLLEAAGFKVIQSGPPTELAEGENAFKRAVKLHFCDIIAQKPGELKGAQPAPAGDTPLRPNSNCCVHFDGTEKGKNTLVVVDGKNVMLPEAVFTNFFLLACALHREATGELPVEKLHGNKDNPHMSVKRLRQKLKPHIDCAPEAFIEMPGDSSAYLSVACDNVTFDLPRLKKHGTGNVREAAGNLKPRKPARKRKS